MNIIKFEKSNCHPCNSVQYFFDTKGVEITRISIEESPEEALAKHVRVVPTTLLVNDAGEELHRVIGYDFKQLSDMLKTLG